MFVAVVIVIICIFIFQSYLAGKSNQWLRIILPSIYVLVSAISYIILHVNNYYGEVFREMLDHYYIGLVLNAVLIPYIISNIVQMMRRKKHGKKREFG